MKIAFVAHGESVHTQRWCAYFVREGHETHLFSFTDACVPGVSYHRLASAPGGGSTWKYLGAVPALRRGIRAVSPDVVLGYYLTSNGVMAALAGRHPLVLSASGNDVLLDPQGSIFRRRLLVHAMRKADLIHSRAEHMTERIAALGAPTNKILTVTNGVDTKIIRFIEKNARPERSPAIVSTRALDDIYHTDSLIHAFRKVSGARPDARCRIAGTGTEERKLKALVRQFGIEAKVEFVGPVRPADMPEFLMTGDVYVSLSETDGASVSLLEAMAAGLFPVVSDIPANREWITDGVNGMLVPYADTNRIAGAVLRALESADGWAEILRKNRAMIEDKGDLDKNMKRITDAMEALCRRNCS